MSPEKGSARLSPPLAPFPTSKRLLSSSSSAAIELVTGLARCPSWRRRRRRLRRRSSLPRRPNTTRSRLSPPPRPRHRRQCRRRRKCTIPLPLPLPRPPRLSERMPRNCVSASRYVPLSPRHNISIRLTPVALGCDRADRQHAAHRRPTGGHRSYRSRYPCRGTQRRWREEQGQVQQELVQSLAVAHQGTRRRIAGNV